MSLVSASFARAAQPEFETVSISAGFVVRSAETQTLKLPAGRFVRNLTVQADGGSSGDAMIDVVVNGETKGSLYVPGRDPNYVVTVGEAASSIQFRHRSGGWARIVAATVVLSVATETPAPLPPMPTVPAPLASAPTIQSLANRAVVVVDRLKPYVSLDDDALYLTPLRRKAGIVTVMLTSRGPFHEQTMLALQGLVEQIDFSRPLIDRMLSEPGFFDLAIELLVIRETIAQMRGLEPAQISIVK